MTVLVVELVNVQVVSKALTAMVVVYSLSSPFTCQWTRPCQYNNNKHLRHQTEQYMAQFSITAGYGNCFVLKLILILKKTSVLHEALKPSKSLMKATRIQRVQME